MISQSVVQEMLRYSPPPPIENPTRVADLDSWGIRREVGDFLMGNSNALLFGAIFDFQIKLEQAWQAPFDLARRLGHFDLAQIARMRPSHLETYIRGGGSEHALHRFPGRLAQRLISASRRLLQEYEGNAENIWPDAMQVAEVIDRLDAFDGIGQKIARMMARLLVSYFGVRLTHWEKLDIAVDRHVARFFLRTGLVVRDPGTYGVAEVADEVTLSARRLCPSFPATLDEPAMDIARNWCTAEEAYCSWAGEPCPMRKVCPKKVAVRVE